MSHLLFQHSNNKPYNWIVYKTNQEFLSQLSGNFRGRLYDLGCGEMPYKTWLFNYADQYTGVDWSSSLHDLNADILADLNEPLPIESKVTDTVMSLSVMEHLREPQVFLNEARLIHKPGGSIVLQVPLMRWVHEAPYDF